MTRKTIRTMIWSAAGLLMSLSVLVVVLSGLSGQMQITDSESISRTADAVMNSVRSSDWQKLNELIIDNPGLEPSTGEENTAERLIWTAYAQSLEWKCSDSFEVQNDRVKQNVTVTCLDISALAHQIRETLAESATDSDYAAALLAAAQQTLDTEFPVLQRDITMTFVRKNGQWKLIPNNTLLALLSGFTAS